MTHPLSFVVIRENLGETNLTDPTPAAMDLKNTEKIINRFVIPYLKQVKEKKK